MRLAPIVAGALCVLVLASVSGSAFGAEAAFRRVVVARGLSEPVQVTGPRSEPRRLYVVEQRGTIRLIDNGKLRNGFFLDMRSRTAAGGEQGLLGLAFDPQYSSNRFIYVNYTDTSGDTRVVRYRTTGTRAIPSTARVLLGIDQPYANHNGGGLAFGPDGGLYVGTGDGGSGGDPENRAQSMDTLLGKMLRLDVTKATPTPEIVAIGLRNPWRFSFDRKTKDLWIGDVGQGSIEEIDHLPRGTTGLVNFGWDVYEGRSSFEDKALGPGRLVQPVAQYTHDDGCSVTGGYVYRGNAIPALRGRYVFGDYCSGTIWSMPATGGALALRVEPVEVPQLTSFGESLDGNQLYAVSQSGTVSRFAR